MIGLAGAALAAGGSAYLSGREKKKGIAASNKAARQAQYQAGEAAKQYWAAVKSSEERAMAGTRAARVGLMDAEVGKFRVHTGLGRRGTYEKQATALVGHDPTKDRVTDPTQSKVVKYKEHYLKKRRLPSEQKAFGSKMASRTKKYRFKTIDPEKFERGIQESVSGRMVSYLTAQADQLLRQEGEIWNRLEANIFGAVTDNAAAMGRQAGMELRNMVAKGGAARRTALANVQKMQTQQQLQRNTMANIREGMQALTIYGMDNARAQEAFNVDWVNNLSGVSQGFTTGMTQLHQYYGNHIMPQMIAAAGTKLQADTNAAAYSAQQQYEGNVWSGVAQGMLNVVAGAALDPTSGFSTALTSAGKRVAGLFGGGAQQPAQTAALLGSGWGG